MAWHGDISSDRDLRHAVRATSHAGDLLLLLLNIRQAAMGFNFVSQLRRFALEHHLLLAPTRGDCDGLSSLWQALGSRPSACSWVEQLMAHPGWPQYNVNASSDVLALYASRWYVASRVTELGVSVLVLDVDAVLLTDVLALLRRRPLADYDVTLTDQGRGSGINCGFVYFNTRPSGSQRSPTECVAKRRAVRLVHGKRVPCRGAAQWFAHLLWERFAFFLNLPRGAEPLRGNGLPNKWVLWEQDLWNDVLRSVEDDLAVHPWNWGKSASTEAARGRWRAAPLSYSREAYQDKLLKTRRKARQLLPSPLGAPSAAEDSPPVHSRTRLTFVPLCAPSNLSIAAETGRCLRAGKLLIAPPWLASLGVEPTLSWATAPNPQTAYVHPVSMWRCFGRGSCFAKTHRVWWMRANRLWEPRLDQFLHAQQQQQQRWQHDSTARLPIDVSLPGGLPAAVRGDAVLELPAATVARARDFYELHRLLHNLVTIGLLIGLTPRIPAVPCAIFANWTAKFATATEGRPPEPLRRFHFVLGRRFGIGLSDVLARGSVSSPRCLLFPSGDRGAGGNCGLDLIDHAFDNEAEDGRDGVTAEAPHALLTLSLEDALSQSTAEARLVAACRAARAKGLRNGRARRVQLVGLDPRSSLIVDGPSPAAREMNASVLASVLSSSAARFRSGVPQLESICPGVSRWVRAEKSCTYYFLRDADLIERSLAAASISHRADDVSISVSDATVSVAIASASQIRRLGDSPEAAPDQPHQGHQRHKTFSSGAPVATAAGRTSSGSSNDGSGRGSGSTPPSGRQAFDKMFVTETWQPLVDANVSTLAPPIDREGCKEKRPPLVAAFLAGPVRSLLTPSVHRTIDQNFWSRFRGRTVLFARLYDVGLLDVSRARSLHCILVSISGGRGEWSAPPASGKAFVHDASHISRCRFASGTQLAQHTYMAQSLERQLATLRACYERMVHYERVQAMRFDWILRTRTDTAFLRPVKPHCAIDPSAIYHARAFGKGGNGSIHHMFADHAAIVPRELAHALFVRVAARLAKCVTHGEALPPSHSEPESFLHHELLALGVRSTNAEWVAPIVVSIDGRMQKWCARYMKLGVAEVMRLGSTAQACADAMLQSTGRWTIEAGLTLTQPVDGPCVAKFKTKATAPAKAPASCSWANGCCARHPRSNSCTSQGARGP